MIVSTHYTEYIDKRTGCIVVQRLDLALCPTCGSVLKVSGTKNRKVINAAGEELHYRLKRYYCSLCNRTHLELPDKIMPRKHYATDVIYNSVINHVADYPCEITTYNRWQQEFNNLISSITEEDFTQFSVNLIEYSNKT